MSFNNRIEYNLLYEDYRKAPGISNSALKWFRKSPAHFKALLDGKIESESTEAQKLGTILHGLILEGTFRAVVHPATYPCEPTAKDLRTERPWTRAANYCKEWEAKQALPVISQAEKDAAYAARDAVVKHPLAGKLLAAGKPEVSLFATCPRTGLQLKARLDYLSPRAIVDLKKSNEADTRSFVRAISKYKYAQQAAFYSYVAKLLKIEVSDFCFIALELEPIPMANVVILSQQDFEIAGEGLRKTLSEVAECESENHWPGYCDTEPNVVTLPNWAHDLEEETIDLEA